MQKLVPITRLGKFFGAEDYDLDIGMGEEWLLGDMNFTVVLYRIDRRKTKTDDVYGEVLEDGIQFLAPVELKGLVQVMAPSSKTYGQSKVELQEPGNMKGIIWVIMNQRTERDTMLLQMMVMLSLIINTHTVGTNRSIEL